MSDTQTGHPYGADYTNIARSDWPQYVTREQALAAGLKRYFTGQACKHGHISERTVINKRCCACSKAYQQTERWRACRKAYLQSERGQACQKAYDQGERARATRKAYDQSERGRATQKAYRQSERGRATEKAYHQTEKGTAAALRSTLGFKPPKSAVKAIHAQRILKRALKELKPKSNETSITQ